MFYYHPKFTDKETETPGDCHMFIIMHFIWTWGDLSGKEIGTDLSSSDLGLWQPLWWRRGALSHIQSCASQTRTEASLKDKPYPLDFSGLRLAKIAPSLWLFKILLREDEVSHVAQKTKIHSNIHLTNTSVRCPVIVW